MKKEYSQYDCLRQELLEAMIPQMLYKGSGEENDDFFQLLLEENSALVQDIYRTMCEDDGVPCPYQEEDFKAEVFSRGNINVLRILPPLGDPELSDILRAYLLYTEHDGQMIKKYFVIKRFEDGSIFDLHITPDIEKVLGEELTGHAGDMEYEFGMVVKDYMKTVLQDMRADKTGNLKTKEQAQGKDGKEQSDMKVTPGQLEEFLRRVTSSKPEK